MTFDEAMKMVAEEAEKAVSRTTAKYAAGGIPNEPEISTYLISQLDSTFSKPIAGIHWNSTIVNNGSGKAADEKRIGADILIHVAVDTPMQRYKKGVLLQAKRTDPNDNLSQIKLDELRGQCVRMLDHTPSSYVINYSRRDMRVGPATRFAGTSMRNLYRQCTWTSFRFFWELFRCPVGDPRIESENVFDIPPPHIIHVNGKGEVVLA